MGNFFSDLRTSCDTRYFGACLVEKEITLWKTGTFEKIARVQPGFDGGGNRYAIDPVNRLIFSGTWGGDLTCYDYERGKVEWHRDDIIGIQGVEISPAFPSSLFITHEPPEESWEEPGITNGVLELDAYTGRTLWEDKGGISNNIYLHPSKPIIVIEGYPDDSIRIFDEEKRLMGSISKVYFAVLDVAFSSDMIAIAEGKQGIKTVGFDGKLIAHHAPTDREPNCLRLAFAPEGLYVFDSWSGAFVTLVDPKSGKVLHEYKRETSVEICFIDEGLRFVDAWGQVCRSSDGQIETRLSRD